MSNEILSNSPYEISPDLVQNSETEKPLVELNHVGLSCSSEEEYQKIIAFFESLGIHGEIRPAVGHQRIFFKLNTELEVQLWDQDQGDTARNFRAHLDVISPNPMTTLQQYGNEAQDWGETEIPRGGVQMTPNIMVMARPPIKNN